MGREIKGLIKRFMAGLLCAMLVATLMPMTPAPRASAIDFPTGTAPDVELYINDSTAPGGYREIKDTDSVDFTTGFYLKYTWGTRLFRDLVGDSADKINKGGTYNLPADPFEGIKIDAGKSKLDVYQDPNDTSTKFATIDLVNKQVTFVDDAILGRLATDTYLGLDCNVDPDAKAEDKEGTVTIKLPGVSGDKTYTIKVNDLKSDGPKIDKTAGTFNKANGTVTWNVTYTLPTKFYDGEPAKIVDTLPEGLEYVSVTDTAHTPAITASSSTVDGKTVVEFTLPDSVKNSTTWAEKGSGYTAQTYEFSYTTKLTDAEKVALLKSGSKKDYSNSIDVTGKKDGTTKSLLSTDPVTKTASMPATPAISKSGSAYNSSDKSITWTIKVNTLGLRPDNSTKPFVLSDTMGSNLTIDGNITITGGGSSSPYTVTPPTVTNGNFELPLDTYTPDSSGMLTIEYKTKVNQAIFNGADISTIQNSATVKMDFTNDALDINASKNNIGPGGTFTTNYITKEKNGNEFLNEDPTLDSHTANVNDTPAGEALTQYKITLNPNALEIEKDSVVWFTELLDATYKNDSKTITPDADPRAGDWDTLGDWKVYIYDTKDVIEKRLTDAGLKISGFEWLGKDGSVLSDTADDNETRKTRRGFKVKIDNNDAGTANSLSKKSPVILVTQSVYDERFLFAPRTNGSDNLALFAPNNATSLAIGGNTYGDNARWEFQNTQNDILQKEAVSYDPENKIMKWKLRISKFRGTAPSDFTVTDVLGENLSYKATSSTFDGVSLGETGESAPVKYDSSTRTITWKIAKPNHNVYSTPGNGRPGFILEYETNVNIPEGSYVDTSDLPITNTATFKLDNSPVPGVSATSNLKLPKKPILTKNGGFKNGTDDNPSTSPTDTKISYTVNINPYMITIPKDGDTTLFVTDKLGEGIVLDAASVKLYEGESVASIGGGNVNVTINKKAATEKTITFGTNPASHTYDFLNNSFSVALPAAAVNKPYVLTYDATATKPGALRNDIEISGYSTTAAPTMDKDNFKVVTLSARAYGGAKLYVPTAGNYIVEVTKVDESNNPIKFGGVSDTVRGAKFDLFVGNLSTKVGEAYSSDTTGTLSFMLPQAYLDTVDGETPVYLVETKAPDGYTITNSITKFKVSDITSATDDKYSLSVQNKVGTPTGDTVTVMKRWVGDDEATRPTEVEVQLYKKNGDVKTPQGSSVKLEKAKGYAYTWTGLTALAAGEEWLVEETDATVLADYDAQSKKIDVDGKLWEIINTKKAPTKGSVSVTKKLIAATGATLETADNAKEFTFNITIVKGDNSPATDLNDSTGATYGIPLTNGVGTFKLKKDDTQIISGLPADYKYTITETTETGFASAVTAGSATGTVAAGTTNTVEFTNTKKAPAGGGSSKPTDPEKKPDDTTKPEDPEKPAETPKPDDTPKPEVTPIPNEPVDPSDPDAIVVDFESEIGITPPPQIKRPGMTADDPQTKPDPSTLKPGTVIDGHRFEGWYIDKEFTKPYDFDTILTDDITLYAKWVKIGNAKSPKTDDMSFPLAGAMGITLIMLLSLWALSDKRYKKTR